MWPVVIFEEMRKVYSNWPNVGVWSFTSWTWTNNVILALTCNKSDDNMY